MGKKQPSPRSWTVHLAAVYRRDRDERLARAYELALSSINSTPKPKTPEEENNHDHAANIPRRDLRARLQ